MLTSTTLEAAGPSRSDSLAEASGARISPRETILLAIVLVAAYHGIQHWVFRVLLPTRAVYDHWGRTGWEIGWDLSGLAAPLLLTISAAGRSGLRLGDWSRWRRVLIAALLPVLATATICPFTSNPFRGGWPGMWIISPLSQELMFSGYLYGLIAAAFPGVMCRRYPIPWVLPITAALFVLWHTPNFLSIPAAFAGFQLFYTFLGGMCFLLARRWTGSILPGVASHMAANFCAWAGV